MLLVCAVIFAVVLQTSVLPVYIAAPFKPDLLLIIMVFMALRGSFVTGTPLAWLLGLLKDVFSGLFLGLNAFTFLLIFLLIKSIADRVYAESSFLFVITISLATIVSVISNLMLLLMLTQTPGIGYSMTAGLIPHILINAFAASLVALLPGFTRGQEIA